MKGSITTFTRKDALDFQSWLCSINYNANTTSKQARLAITLQQSNQTKRVESETPKKKRKDRPIRTVQELPKTNSPTQPKTP